MPIPSVEAPCWARLAAGAVPGFKTEHIALKFLLKRLSGDAIAPATKARELHAFFVKFERLLGSEITTLSK